MRLGEREDEPWVCPIFVTSELPFADASLTSVGEDNERGASFGVDEQCPIMSMLKYSPCAVKVAHLNVRSLLPEMDSLRDAFARCQQGQSHTILTLNETCHGCQEMFRTRKLKYKDIPCTD